MQRLWSSRITRVWCISVLDPETGREQTYGPARIPEALRVLHQAGELAGHNISEFDLPVLGRLYGFEYRGRVVDTLILSRLIFNRLSEEADSHGKHALGAWGQRLGCPKGDWTDFSRWDPQMATYCAQDCQVTARLLEHLRAARPSAAACRLELDYAAYLRRIERHGFGLDVAGCRELEARIQRRLASLRAHLDAVFPPEQITGNRPAWYSWELKESGLFDDPLEIPQLPTKAAAEVWPSSSGSSRGTCSCWSVRRSSANDDSIRSRHNRRSRACGGSGWDPQQENKSGSISTSEFALWHSGLPAGKLIAAYRGYAKLLSFARQWLAHQQDGRLYPRFIGNYTVTNRSSSRSPNIQQIPSGKERTSGMHLLEPYGHRCRALFGPRAGYTLVGADLKGIEGRLLGHRLLPFDGGAFARIVCDPKADLHQVNADKIGIEREHAKRVLYGSLYGIGPTALAAQLQITENKARDIIDQFTTGLEGFADLKKSLRQELKSTGRIGLIDGRRLQCSSDHKALNYAISGDAAVLFKHWVLEVAKQLQGSSYRLLAVVHDEMQAECVPDEIEQVERCLQTTAGLVGQRLGFGVQIAADTKHGASWAQTH